jgi:hypothetical protein
MTERRLTSFRLAEVRHGDTLQGIAARELGDASKWADLIAINDLVYPYLTGDPDLASDKVKLYGTLLIVPSTASRVSSAGDEDAVFGIDLDLTGGVLTARDGDFVTVGGRRNLRQAILHRLRTAFGELLFHGNYGLGAHRLRGAVNGPTTGILSAEYVRGAMLSDPRIAKVGSSIAQVDGDRVAVTASVQPVTGEPMSVSEVL